MQVEPLSFTDSVFSAFYGGGALAPRGGFSDFMSHALASLPQEIRLDVVETDTAFCVAADLPGVALKDVRVDVDAHNVLRISAERSAATATPEASVTYHRNERAVGLKTRNLQLPSHADAARISATLEQGVLRVVVHKLAGLGLINDARRRIAISPLGKSSTAKGVVDHYAVLKGVEPGLLLAGKTALVTGAGSGLGLETVKALSYAGCRVLATARNPAAAKADMVKYIDADSDGYRGASALVTVLPLDLESLASVRSLAAAALAAAHKLDFVVCNAGVVLDSHQRTPHGFEKTLGVNHIAHHFLVSELRERLVAQPTGARIVYLSSTGHFFGTIDLADLNFEHGRSYSMWAAYGQSKLANLLDAKELSDQLAGTEVVAVSVHPGVIQTPIFRNMSLMQNGLTGPILKTLMMDKTIAQGAATTVYGLLEPSLAEAKLRGSYLSDCAVTVPSAEARDHIKQHALWAATEAQLNAALAKMT